MLKGFRDFIMRGNLVDLAVAFVIGAAFAALLKEFVTDLISPLLGLFGGGRLSSLDGWLLGPFKVGSFINAALTFLITAAVIYFFVVKPMNALMIRIKGPKAVGDKACPYCLSTIALGATRCPNCTSQLEG